MDEEQARAIIAGGESLTVEFKVGLSSTNAKSICKEIAALATSQGGFLFIGVDDDSKIIGIENPASVQEKIERWASDLISPMPTLNSVSLVLNDRNVVVVEVADGTAPLYSFNEKFYGRTGSSSCALNATQLIDIIRGRKVEDIIRSMESSVALAQSTASSAMYSTAPAIMGQGELATMNYHQVKDRVLADLRTSAAFLALESGVAAAQSTASVALTSPAPAIARQGELATADYASIMFRVIQDVENASFVRVIQSTIATAHSAAANAQFSAHQAQTACNNNNSAVADLSSRILTLNSNVSQVSSSLQWALSRIAVLESTVAIMQSRLDQLRQI